MEFVSIFFLELDQIGNFGAAWSAPRRPKIEKDNFAVRCGQRQRLPIDVFEFEIGSEVGIADEADDRAGIRPYGSGLLSEEGRGKLCGKGEEKEKFKDTRKIESH